jgi:hypothetical protein
VKPWVTQRDPEQANLWWHGIYHHARVVFGTLAGFKDPEFDGFDPATKSIANIFYLGHRRTEDTPVREVRWRDGLALDGEVLLAQAIEASISTTATSTRSTSSSSTTAASVRLQGTQHVKKYLPPDTPITLTSSGQETGVIAFEYSQNSHCLCPEHGGSGRGSAWVTVSAFGPAVHCCQCNGGTTWFPDAVSLPSGFVVPSMPVATEENIQALLADLDQVPVKKGVKAKAPKMTPEQAESLRAADAGRAVEGAKKWSPSCRSTWRRPSAWCPHPAASSRCSEANCKAGCTIGTAARALASCA